MDFEGCEVNFAFHDRARAVFARVITVYLAGYLAELVDRQLAAAVEGAVDAGRRAVDAAAAQLEQDLGLDFDVGGGGFGLRRRNAGHSDGVSEPRTQLTAAPPKMFKIGAMQRALSGLCQTEDVRTRACDTCVCARACKCNEHDTCVTRVRVTHVFTVRAFGRHFG